jgi:hypothetical protein
MTITKRLAATGAAALLLSGCEIFQSYRGSGPSRARAQVRGAIVGWLRQREGPR